MTALSDPTTALPLADTPLGRTVALGPTDIWNDSCAVDELEYAISLRRGGRDRQPHDRGGRLEEGPRRQQGDWRGSWPRSTRPPRRTSSPG